MHTKEKVQNKTGNCKLEEFQTGNCPRNSKPNTNHLSIEQEITSDTGYMSTRCLLLLQQGNKIIKQTAYMKGLTQSTLCCLHCSTGGFMYSTTRWQHPHTHCGGHHKLSKENCMLYCLVDVTL